MRDRRHRLGVGMTALFLLVGGARYVEGGPLYQVTAVDLLPGGSRNIASGINAAGQVVGASTTADGSFHAFLYSDGRAYDLGIGSAGGINASGQVAGSSGNQAFLWTPTDPNGTSGSMTSIGTLPGGTFSEGVHINTRGQVVGTSGVPGHFSAFLWSPTAPNGTSGSMIDLGTLPGTLVSQAGGINDSGQVVGRSISDRSLSSAFLWTPTDPNGTSGSMTSIGTLPGGTFSEANGINASGQVTGASGGGGSGHAFLWTPTDPNGTSDSFIDLGTLPGTRDSSGIGINGRGQVVGAAGTLGLDVGFLYSDGVMFDLKRLVTNGSGWTFDLPVGINESGQIVGTGTFEGVQRAFLLTPVPEPGSLMLLGLGFAGLLGHGWCRRERVRMGDG